MPPEMQAPDDPWAIIDDAGNTVEQFKYIELEFLFNRDIEATHISEMIAEIVKEFETRIVDAELVWDKDDPGVEEGAEGGVALYAIFPNRPGLLQAFQDQLVGFDVEITIWPTKGM
jgi:hypothetical protein